MKKIRNPKPGFKNYIKTRIKHPFMSNDSLIYVSASGDRFRDVGSVYTPLIPLIIAIFWLITQFTLNYTIYGRALIAVPLILYRFLRYFWTSFERVAEGGELIQKNGDLIVSKAKKHSKAVEKLLQIIGLDEDQNEERYVRYSGQQKVFMALKALLLIAAFSVLFIILSNSQYSVAYKLNDDKEYLDKGVDTIEEAYALSRGHIDKNFPEFQLVNYGVDMSSEGKSYTFIFKNPMRGLFIYKAAGSIIVFIDDKEKSIQTYYDHFSGLLSRFEPLREPVAEIDTKKIINIVLLETGVSEHSLEYVSVFTHFWKFDSPNLTDPGGDTWAVELQTNSDSYYYVVNVAEGTAVRSSNAKYTRRK